MFRGRVFAVGRARTYRSCFGGGTDKTQARCKVVHGLKINNQPVAHGRGGGGRKTTLARFAYFARTITRRRIKAQASRRESSYAVSRVSGILGRSRDRVVFLSFFRFSFSILVKNFLLSSDVKSCSTATSIHSVSTHTLGEEGERL